MNRGSALLLAAARRVAGRVQVPARRVVAGEWRVAESQPGRPAAFRRAVARVAQRLSLAAAAGA